MAMSEWLPVVSILSSLLSPLIALRVSQWLERKRGSRARKEEIFKTLMSTRGAPLSRVHVEALNMIDVEFYNPTDKKILEVTRAWIAYHDHLNNKAMSLEVWGQRKEELFVDLLFKMAQYLGYDFDRTRIKNSAYIPVAYGDAEEDQLTIRRGLASVFRGEREIPIALALKNTTHQLPAVAALPNQLAKTEPLGKGEEVKSTSGS